MKNPASEVYIAPTAKGVKRASSDRPMKPVVDGVGSSAASESIVHSKPNTPSETTAATTWLEVSAEIASPIETSAPAEQDQPEIAAVDRPPVRVAVEAEDDGVAEVRPIIIRSTAMAGGELREHDVDLRQPARSAEAPACRRGAPRRTGASSCSGTSRTSCIAAWKKMCTSVACLVRTA